ncbi:PqqD family protein [Butyricicoccus sp. Marseille-Q5471]|uniref:PqqD family protein n=1 Tax=Butyricicoccus sp. Marseille-Q5471 TaxID=3039493 RepID=UPI0024BD519A|nr:PqqD family protein [Butyricicoccus sp. Marseille-Q5471]
MPKKKDENYLDYIPQYHPRHTWSENDKGIVTIHMVHKGFYAFIAQKFFRTPRVSHIDLDAYGSFLWKLIDGKKTVGRLADDMRAQFGKAAEPVYDRLVKYVQILRNNGFIYMQGKDKVKQ